MDAYPPQYVAHNVPLVSLFGLETLAGPDRIEDESEYPNFHQSHFSLSSELPPIAGQAAEALRQAFRDLDANDAAWNGRPGPGKMGSMTFTSRDVGRTIKLPAHKAAPPTQAEKEDLPPTWNLVLHSPISPLTPSSRLYPDGIFSPIWASKHQRLVPAAVICFFGFTVDASRSTLEDNALKTQINNFKSWKAETKYATRIVVILVCDEAAPVSAVVERLGNIRRSTNLDTKTLLYMPGGLSADETRAFVGSLLSNIHPNCIEYYRDLSKHARRKKNRANVPQPTVPPTSGTSQTLSARGWNVRYEVKLGILAEFRGEIDAAERNYEQAYEDLMDGDVFEGISNWSHRFNEGRMLADALAIRILRCLLWTNQTTSAAQSWANHKYRMQEVVDKKGKGSNTYAWQAWEANWSTVMAELIERVQIPFFHVSSPTDEAPLVIPNIFAPPEKSLAKDIMVSPWDHLHHPGYWYARSAQRVQSRRMLARAIPSEDRRPPGESPASALANRSHLYDSYMVPDPHIEYNESMATEGLHSTLLVDAYGKAAIRAQEKQEERMTEKLRLGEAKALAERDEWAAAATKIRPFFKSCSYVRQNWWTLWQEVLLLASRVAFQVADAEFLLLVNWQLQSTLLTISNELRPDLTATIQALDPPDKPSLSLEIDTAVPVVGASFTFGDFRAHVGDTLPCQVILGSFQHSKCGPLTLNNVEIEFTGCNAFSKVRFEHDPNIATYSSNLADRPKAFQHVNLQPSSSDVLLHGAADLTILSGCVNVYEFTVTPSDAQDFVATKISISATTDYYSLIIEQKLSEPRTRPLFWWKPTSNGQFSRLPLYLSRYRTVEVKPRPPKLEVAFMQSQDVFYTDEKVQITIRITNAESETADVRLKVHLSNPHLDAMIHWVDSRRESQVLVGETGVALPQRDLGSTAAAATHDVVFAIEKLRQATDVVVEVEAVYTLASNPNTIIAKSIKQTFAFVQPFTVDYETLAGVHPAPWPSYFQLPVGNEPAGIAQRSYLAAKITDSAKETIIIESVELQQIDPKDSSVLCNTEQVDAQHPTEIQSGTESTRTFRVDVQKRDLDDRSQSLVHMVLAITWHRKRQSSSGEDHDARVTTFVDATPIAFDFGKPRALVAAIITSVPAATPFTPIIHLKYTLENPSDYMLTFGVSMDANDQFAFAGPKATSLQLAPLSRADVRFTLLPLVKGAWISPVVRVNDLGFKETLKVMSAEGVKTEKGRCLVWVPENE